MLTTTTMSEGARPPDDEAGEVSPEAMIASEGPDVDDITTDEPKLATGENCVEVDPVWSREVEKMDQTEESEKTKEATAEQAFIEQARAPAVMRPFVSGVESDTQLERLHLADEATSRTRVLGYGSSTLT